MDTVSIERTFDAALCYEILTNPEIWCTISEDNADPLLNVPSVWNEWWLKLEADGNVIGIVRLHARLAKLIQGHIHILPEYRRDYSHLAGQKILDWISDNFSKDTTILTEVPEIYPNVIAFLKDFQFQEQGIIPSCYSKDQKLHSLVILTKRGL